MLNVAVSVHTLSMYIGAHSASSFSYQCLLLADVGTNKFDICRRKSQIIFILFPQFLIGRSTDENQTQIKHDIRLNDIYHNDIQHKS
jgi:hypothetical protein